MKMTWIIYALLGMILFSIMILLFKKLTLLNVNPATLMLFVSLVLLLSYAGHVFFTKADLKVSPFIFLLLLLAGIVSYVGNFLYIKSIALAPNPGYVATIVGLQLAVIAIGSVFLFGSELTATKGIGIALAIVAGILLAL